MAVLPQATKICLNNLLYFYFFEVFLVKSPFNDLILESVVVLSLEDKKVRFFIRAIASFIDEIMSF